MSILSFPLSPNSNFYSSEILNNDKEIKDYRKQLYEVSHPSLFNRYLIVGKNGLKQTNLIAYIFANLKRLFAYPNITDRYAIRLEALRLVLKANELSVDTEKDCKSIEALVERVGLFSQTSNDSGDLTGLIEEIRHKIFVSCRDLKQTAKLEEKRNENVLLLKRYVTYYNKQLAKNFPEEIEKVNHQYTLIFEKKESQKVIDSHEQIVDTSKQIIDADEQVIHTQEQTPDIPNTKIEENKSWTIDRENFPLDTISELSKKILKIALPLFITAGCALQRNNITLLLERTYRAFLGQEGWVPPTVMISTCLALKYIIYLNQKPDDQKFSNTTQIVRWVKKIPNNFAIGVGQLPNSLKLTTSILIISLLIFSSLSINVTAPDFAELMDEHSIFEAAAKGPFLEELFFRELFQGSLISTMKLINLAGFRMGKNAIIREETLHSISRIFSATAFGLLHYNQSAHQAIGAGISSYYCETWLYEKKGLFASFGLHSASNFVGFCLSRLFV